MDMIVHEYRGNAIQINIEILQQWIRGETGNLKEPVSWRTLTACLRNSGLSELAEDIEQVLL